MVYSWLNTRMELKKIIVDLKEIKILVVFWLIIIGIIVVATIIGLFLYIF